MLARSASARRRRASRCAASPSHLRLPRSGSTPPGNRRASIAVSPSMNETSINVIKSSPERSPLARSPRPSVSDVPLSPRSSPRNSLVPEYTSHRSQRNSLVPDPASVGFNKSPRSSLTPEAYTRSRRNSLAPDTSRSPRHSLAPVDVSGSRQNVAGSRHNLEDPHLAIESLARTSPRGSLGGADGSYDVRTPRGSLTPEHTGRSPRGSISKVEDFQRSPRGSLTLTFDESVRRTRRASVDSFSTSRGLRSVSPYRGMSLRAPVHSGYATSTNWAELSASRRTSNAQPGDEQRRLCADKSGPRRPDPESGSGMALGMSLTTYGSVTYQLKDANMEASGTLDFVCRALTIVNKTVAVTILLICLSALPVLMLIMGIDFLRDCPRESNIPLYMVVGGAVGCVKMMWLIWDQISRRHIDDSQQSTPIAARVASALLTLFLVAWFALGNYWILHVKWPDYAPTLYEPNHWCHRTLYIFALVHLAIIYGVFAIFCVMVLTFACCQLIGCSWLGPIRYK